MGYLLFFVVVICLLLFVCLSRFHSVNSLTHLLRRMHAVAVYIVIVIIVIIDIVIVVVMIVIIDIIVVIVIIVIIDSAIRPG